MQDASFGQAFDELIDPPVWVVTAAAGGERGGLVATFVSNASLVPDEPRVLVGIAKHHFTWGLIDRSQAFGLHLVARDRIDWVRRFGLKTGREGDKFEGLEPAAGDLGSPIFTEAVLWAECAVEATLDTGDRTLFLARVTRHGRGESAAAMRVSMLIEALGESERAEMLKRLNRDMALDAAAIGEWRAGG
ncbi:MAG TPA: flavin reductase family protein [Planctomycetia bacterium]|nr:flavin reductase family protein [Planctomycetia bacterium]